MVYMMDKLTRILVIVCIVLILISICAVVGFIMLRRKRKNVLKEDMGVDYDTFERKNSLAYVKFDDIFDDMIITDNFTRFIAIIRCQGFDFYYAHIATQYSAQTGYRGFMNTVSTPITYRQYTRAVDMERIQNNYYQAYHDLQETLYNLSEDYSAAKRRLREYEEKTGMESGQQDEELEFMMDTLIKMQRQIEAIEWRLLHIKDQLVYIEQVSQGTGIPNREETYIMDWVYNPFDFPVELSREEIIEKAKVELKRLAREKINALSSSGVKAFRCTTEELIDMNRRHLQPYSAERYKMRDVAKSRYFDDITEFEGKNDLKQQHDEELTMKIVESLQREFAEDAQRYTDVGALAFEMSEKGEPGNV